MRLQVVIALILLVALGAAACSSSSSTAPSTTRVAGGPPDSGTWPGVTKESDTCDPIPEVLFKLNSTTGNTTANGQEVGAMSMALTNSKSADGKSISCDEAKSLFVGGADVLGTYVWNEGQTPSLGVGEAGSVEFESADGKTVFLCLNKSEDRFLFGCAGGPKGSDDSKDVSTAQVLVIIK